MYFVIDLNVRVIHHFSNYWKHYFLENEKTIEDFSSMIAQSEKDKWEKFLLSLEKESKETYEGEVKFKFLKGERFKFRSTLVENGIFIVSLNSLEEKNKKKDLNRENIKLNQALDEQCLVTRTNTDGEIIYANSKFLEVTGYPSEELIGKRHNVLNSNFHDRDFFQDLWETIKSGFKWRGELRNKTKSGNHIWVDSHIIPVRGENGDVEEFINISIDITDKKKLEEDLIRENNKNEFILETVKLGSMVWDLNNNKLQIDRIWRDLAGFTVSSIEIEDFERLIHPKDKIKLFTMISDNISGKSPKVDCIFRMKRSISNRDGFSENDEYIFVKMRGEISEYDSSGAPIKFTGACLDYTKQMEKELYIRKSRNQLKNFIEQIPQPIAFINKDFEIISTSDNWPELWKVRDKKDHLNNIMEFFPILPKRVIEGLNMALEGLLSFGEDQIENVYGTKHIIRWISKPWIYRGEVEGIVFLTENISEEINLRNDLENERIKSIHSSKLASLGEISGSIAHEVNNPLTIIHGYLQQMEIFHEDGELTDQKLTELIQKTLKTVMRASKIVSSFKNFARDGDIDDHNLYTVKHLLDTTFTLCSHKLKNAGVEVEVIGEQSYEIVCKEIQLSQVLVNLISNACDEINNHENPWIKLYIENNCEEILFRIVDSGKGIPEDIAEKVFQPYFTSKPKGEGTGLGMSISKNIIEAHKGTITYERYEGNTSFVIRIPRDFTIEEESNIKIAA